jgi:hypothetical protein
MKTHWWPEPSAGDIVWCNFPENSGMQPSAKPRPALIFRVFDDNTPHFDVEVVYGTSQKTEQLLSGEFVISNKEAVAYQLAGLSYPTKFNFKNTAQVPFNDEWFKVPPKAPHGKTPKLGVLHPSLIKKVQAAWSAIQ